MCRPLPSYNYRIPDNMDGAPELTAPCHKETKQVQFPMCWNNVNIKVDLVCANTVCTCVCIRGGTVHKIHGSITVFDLVRYTLIVQKINYVLYCQVKTEKMRHSDIWYIIVTVLGLKIGQFWHCKRSDIARSNMFFIYLAKKVIFNKC